MSTTRFNYREAIMVAHGEVTGDYLHPSTPTLKIAQELVAEIRKDLIELYPFMVDTVLNEMSANGLDMGSERYWEKQVRRRLWEHIADFKPDSVQIEEDGEVFFENMLDFVDLDDTFLMYNLEKEIVNEVKGYFS